MSIDEMTGREVADFVLAHMERGEKMMCTDHEKEDFVRGFKVAVIGLQGGLQILDGENKGKATMQALTQMVDLYVPA